MKSTSFFGSVLDFFKKLPRKQNIPIMIYLIVNVLITYVGTAFVLYEAFSMGDSSFAASIPISIAVYFVGICISFSPLGEWILRRKNGCDKIEDEETAARLQPLFDEVLGKAREINPSIPEDVRLYTTGDDDVNAFAIGRKTICVTTGALNLPDDQLKAVIGHELGHISNHDTDLALVVNVANMFVTAYFLAIKIYLTFIRLSAKLFKIISFFTSATIGEFLVNLIGGTLVDIIALFTIKMVSALWTAFGNLLIKASTRGNEYLADEFSKELGYGASLAEFLSTLESKRHKLNVFKRVTAVLSDTHPAPEKRIESLNK